MKTLVIVTHPNMKKSTINRKFAEEAAKLENVDVHDLYATYPDWNIDVKKEQDMLLDYDRIVFQFPLYWYAAPGLLKLWYDKILAPGYAYGAGGDKVIGKQIIIATSVGSSEEAYTNESYQNYTVASLLRPYQQTAQLLKMHYLEPYMVYNADRITEEALEDALQRYLTHIQDEDLPKVDMYFGDKGVRA